MEEALAALLEEVIDYAGMFWPASLGAAEAAAEYAELLAKPEGMLVRNFVVERGRIAELLPLLPEDDGWSLTLICGEQPPDDLEELARQLPGESCIAGVELRAASIQAAGELGRRLRSIPVDEAFIEVPWADWQMDAVHELASIGGKIGVKARLGGKTVGDTPEAGRLAALLHECLSLDLPIKLTAGLHSPLPRVNPATGAHEHGFLNVFSGAALALANDLSPGHLIEILNLTDIEQLNFDDDRISWKSWHAPLDAIEEARGLLGAFGSCSVAEPVEGLRSLGLWKAGAAA